MQYTYDQIERMQGTIKYKITESGTAYHIETDDELVRILENIRHDGTRVTLDYGDVKTGESWGEQYDITGTLSRSTGRIKIPILIHNSRSFGGGAILDHCIIGIKHSNKSNGGDIYRVKVTK